MAKSVAPLAAAERYEPIGLAELYRRHAQTVARWAQRLGGPLMDVEDVVQEVYVIAHRELAGFRGDASITTWLYRITLNVVHHRRRKEKLRRWLSGSAEETAGHLPSRASDPGESLEQRQNLSRFYAALDGMKEKYRTVLVLFELEELSGAEIAELNGIKLATVWVWLHRARAELLKCLEALEGKES